MLDLGAGTGGPAVVLAKHFRCRVTAVENSSSFAEAGRERARAAGVSDLIEYVISDVTEFSIERGAYDAAVCFGAAWILGGFAGTAEALRAAVPLGGHVVIGDVFEPSEPRPDQEGAALTLRGMLTTMVGLGLTPVGMTVASHDDWDRYHSQMMLAFEDWIDAQTPTTPISLTYEVTGRANCSGPSLSWMQAGQLSRAGNDVKTSAEAIACGAMAVVTHHEGAAGLLDRWPQRPDLRCPAS
ncbi:hypothetical protein GCM10023317_11790 [Actinopolymorpha pittospori]|uniref:SAM-dependent methyltransferase n=1 Tax=Actinopolymorpha pittospori TaxID=648752 RepID=A0A927RI19_9ACTN|nr:SAM-dependent methyltransferase [Actinopolymorpha pittospori]